MKRGGELRRTGKLQADPARTEAWLRRSAKKYQENLQEKQDRKEPVRKEPIKRLEPVRAENGRELGTSRHRRVQKRAAQRRNDAPWRNEVFELRGRSCRGCGGVQHVQADHLIPRSQGGPSVVENGLPLCGEFGVGQCHVRKTAHSLLIERGWLDQDQIDWLKSEGHAWWREDGTVAGRHCVLFAPVRVV